MKTTNRAEEIRKANQEKAARVKELYHGSRLCDNRQFTVEIKPMSCWTGCHWFFENLEDAKAYAQKETKGQARVIKMTMVDAHTMNTEVVFNK